MRRQTDAQRGGVSGKRQVLQAAGRNHRVDQPVFLFLQRDTGPGREDGGRGAETGGPPEDQPPAGCGWRGSDAGVAALVRRDKRETAAGSTGMGTAGEKQVWNPCPEYLCGDRRPEGTLQGADAAKISGIVVGP